QLPAVVEVQREAVGADGAARQRQLAPCVLEREAARDLDPPPVRDERALRLDTRLRVELERRGRARTADVAGRDRRLRVAELEVGLDRFRMEAEREGRRGGGPLELGEAPALEPDARGRRARAGETRRAAAHPAARLEPGTGRRRDRE